MEILILTLLLLLKEDVALGQSDRYYLPPTDFVGPRPPLNQFNFLNLPIPVNPPPRPPFFASPPALSQQTCNPPPVDQLVPQSSWHPIKKADTLYPIIRYSKRDEYSHFVGHAKCPTALSDNDRDCVTYQWNSAGNEVEISSYDGCELKSHLSRCEQLDRDRFLVRCIFENNVTITQNIVKTDGQIWMLGYECFTNADGSPGSVSWSVYSIYNKVPDSLRKEIRGYVRDLGFDPDDNREPRYDNCPALPNRYPELRSYPITETNKIRSAPTVCNPPPLSTILPSGSWKPEKKDDVLYFPVVYTQRSSAEYISNDDPVPCGAETNLRRRKQCLSTKFNSAKFESEFRYFDECATHRVSYKCSSLAKDKIALSCVGEDGLEIKSWAVLGDNHTYLLNYECWNRERKPVTWALLSVYKTVPESLKRLVLDFVERNLGFDFSDFREVDYSKCPQE